MKTCLRYQFTAIRSLALVIALVAFSVDAAMSAPPKGALRIQAFVPEQGKSLSQMVPVELAFEIVNPSALVAGDKSKLTLKATSDGVFNVEFVATVPNTSIRTTCVLIALVENGKVWWGNAVPDTVINRLLFQKKAKSLKALSEDERKGLLAEAEKEIQRVYKSTK
jgi:hypothetical protein